MSWQSHALLDDPQTVPKSGSPLQQAYDLTEQTTPPKDRPPGHVVTYEHFLRVHQQEPPRRSDVPFVYAQPPVRRDPQGELQTIEKHYLLLDSPSEITKMLMDEPAMFSLLVEAIGPLRRVFGEQCIVYGRIQSSDDTRLFRVAVHLPVNFRDPEAALRAFDEEWWLNNCHRSGGMLVFDYELQDAV